MSNRNKNAFSIVEIILAVAVFGIMASSLVITALGGYNALNISSQQSKASSLAEEAIFRARSLNWGDIKSLSEEKVDRFSRIVLVEELCRKDGIIINSCKNEYDIIAKKINVKLTWQNIFGRESILERITYVYKY